MHLAQDFFRASKRRLNVSSHFVFRVDTLDDLDLKVKAALPLLVEHPATHKPSIFGHVDDDDGDNVRLLPQNARGQFDEQS